MMRRLGGLLLLLSLWLAIPLVAGQDPNLKRGIAPGNTYGSYDIDTINEFNGNLVLRIPLSELPVGPFLSQGLVLAYNSKVYNYQVVEYEEDVDHKVYKRRAVPEDFSNAGFGWTISLGRLVQASEEPWPAPARGWFYRAPDGSEHDFDRAVSPYTGKDDPAQAITHDGSFLRFKRYPADLSQPATHREIEFGDGTIHRFGPNGDLIQIRDRVGHTIDIDYSALQWVITNSYNGNAFRTTTVNFENRTAPPGYTYANPNFQKVIHSIVVPAFGGGTATYELTYTDASFPRGGNGDYIPTDPANIAAPLLTEILFPEGAKYTFLYPSGGGEVGKVILPTKGSIEWTQQTYALSRAECDEINGWIVDSPGVYQRILRDAQGDILGQWTYTTSIDAAPWGSTYVACGAFDGHNFPWGPAPTEITTTVTMKDANLAPVGGETKHYFSGTLYGPRATALGYKVEEYGLPFTRRVPDTSNNGRFLSTERRDASNTLVRSTYLTYAGEPPSSSDGLGNARVRGALTVYDNDTGCGGVACRTDTDRPESDYDGYGHYRKAVTTSNFGPARTTFTNYLAPQTDPWILGTYDSSWVEQGGAARKQLFTFDGNGVLRTLRTLAGSATTAASITTDPQKDLLAVSCRDARGFLTSERFFGGDGAAAWIPTTDPCNATPAATEFQIDHSFTFDSNGAPTSHTARYPGMPFFIADEDLDVSTGLVSASRDVSGVSTLYQYDGLGRLKEVKPAGGAWTLYEYGNASGTTVPASVHATTRPYNTASTATPLTDAYIYYDSMGRSIQEKARIPVASGPPWSTTKTVYDLFGRRTAVSVPELENLSSYESTFTPAELTSTVYDIFGRPVSISTPDDKTASISYTGSGVREIRKTTGVALSTGAADVTTEELYDAYGRLTQVTEPTGTVTRHTYDLAGHLTKVCQNTVNAGVSCGQSRTFVYDNRGFLQSETHPESGTISYSYDSRGHALTKAIAGDPSSERNLKFFYDSAERLTEVQTHHPTQSSYRPGKGFTFGSENTANGTNKQLGKLTSATRYNFGTGQLVVTESYDYVGTAGRLSKTTTDIIKDGSLLQKLEQSQAYDGGGNPATITYPTCLFVSCGSPAWNAVTSTFTNGFLTKVDGFADSITYTAAGAVSQVDHTGPVTDTYTPDETGVRPKAITFEGHSSCAAPAISAGSPQDQAVTSGGSTTLTVSASGASGVQWYEGNGTVIAGATSVSFTTPILTSTKTYYVVVSNSCGTATSRTVTVTVCPSLSITAGSPQDQSIAPEQTATLTVSASGATGYQWYDGNGVAIVGQTAASFTTPILTSTKTYSVRATNACGTVTSRTATVTVRSLPPPTGLVATATGTSSVSISWNASADAHHYVLERKSGGSAFQAIQSVSTTSATNAALAANVTYVYRVKAVSSSEAVASAPSNADLATTMVFTPLTAGQTAVRASHFEELLGAVNAVRAATGTPPATWSLILPAGVPAPGPGVRSYAQHVLSLRSAMNSARTALGVAALSYTDPNLTVFPVRVVHQTEIRGGVE